LLKPGEVVIVDFPGVMGMKRRPAVVVSSDAYHSARPDVIVGLITSQVAGSTDRALADWSAAGLRLPSLFRSFLVTVPRTAVYHDQASIDKFLREPRWQKRDGMIVWNLKEKFPRDDPSAP
jgi:mRNA interferase MazF